MTERTKTLVVTQEGHDNMTRELEHLKTVRRREIAERIKIAREFGDLSENAEYDEAKNEQGFIEGRISELENRLKIATVINDSDISTEDVGIGSHVKVKKNKTGKVIEYKIVGSTESDPRKYMISNESPVGKGLMGARVGDVVNIQIPDGEVQYKIVEISR